jgi:lysophospholipase L1-like esterase
LEVELRKLYEPARNLFIPVDPKQDTLFKAQQKSDPDAVFRDAIEGVCEVARTNHIQPVLLFLPPVYDLATNAPADSVLRMKRSAAAKFAAPLVDLTPALRPYGKTVYLDADLLHLNAQGNAIVAERLFETFTNHFIK